MIRIKLRLFILLPAILCACENSQDSFTTDDHGVKLTELTEPTSSSKDLDTGQVAETNRQAGEMEDILSLLVIRDGAIICEKYFHGASQSSVFNVKSVSKSFVSALIGIAIKERYISSLEQKAAEFFPEYFISGDGAQKREITIRHLLTMTSGLEWTENGPVVNAWVASSDWVRFALGLPLVYRPGEVFNYTTAGTHILSAVITKATKMSALDFGNRFLFQPAGINVQRWDSDPQGNNFGGAEMYLTARDMAKFGLLYLNGGSFDGKQYIPADWVRESTRIQVDAGDDSQKEGYGYLWWISQSRGISVYFAAGYGGQFIFIIPDLDLVVVTTSSLANSRDQDRINKHRTLILKLLTNQIMPSVME